MSDENIQILRRAICAGCLSQDRKLFPVKNLKQYAMFCYAVSLDEKDWVCWECQQMVIKLAVFRSRAVKAQAVLTDLLNGRPCQIKSLSKLSIITISDNADDVDVDQKPSTSDPVYYQLVKEAVQSDEEVMGELVYDANDSTPLEVTFEDHSYEALMNDDDDEASHDGTVTNVTVSNIFDNTVTPKPRFKTQAVKNNTINIIKVIETEVTEAQDNEAQINSMEVENPLDLNTIEVENSEVNTTEIDNTEDNTIEVEVPKTSAIIEVVTPFTEEKMSEDEMILWRVRKRNIEFFANCSPLLRCEECMEPFDNQRLYTGHMKFHTKPFGEHSCDICELRFHDEDEVKLHKTKHYSLFKCKYCEFVWDSRNGMRRHCVDAHGVPITAWNCDLCPRVYPNLKKFGEHRDCHRARQCPECGVILRSFLKKHMMKAHKNLPMVTCEICGLQFKGNSGLQMHQKDCYKVADEKYCAECDHHFSNKYSYRAHMKNSVKHARDRRLRFQCTECGKGFGDSTSLINHMDGVHDRRKKYPCDQCSEMFHTVVSRRRHVRRTHEGKQPARDKICDYCGKAFTLRRILFQHMNKHTGARPYKCECGVAFGFRAALAIHKQNQHKMPRTKGIETPV